MIQSLAEVETFYGARRVQFHSSFLQIIFKVILLLNHLEKVSKLLNTGLNIPKSLVDID